MQKIIIEDWFEAKFTPAVRDLRAPATNCRAPRACPKPCFRTSQSEPCTTRSPYRIQRSHRISVLSNA